jgi:hypothetical protein
MRTPETLPIHNKPLHNKRSLSCYTLTSTHLILEHLDMPQWPGPLDELTNRLECLASVTSSDVAHSAATSPNPVHKIPATQTDLLHCSTCYSCLERDQFTKAQKTGRRSYGHPEAAKRLRISGGFQHKKWSNATPFSSRLLPCAMYLLQSCTRGPEGKKD